MTRARVLILMIVTVFATMFLFFVLHSNTCPEAIDKKIIKDEIQKEIYIICIEECAYGILKVSPYECTCNPVPSPVQDYIKDIKNPAHRCRSPLPQNLENK